MAKAILKNGQIYVDGKPAIVSMGTKTWLQSQPEGTEAFVKSEKVVFGFEVGNGECYTKTGFKHVVIDKEGNYKPVVYRTTKGYAPNCCSYQAFEPEKGDIVLGINWGHGEDGETIFEYNMVNREDYNGEMRHYLSDPRPYDFRVEPCQDAIDWLKPQGRNVSYFMGGCETIL